MYWLDLYRTYFPSFFWVLCVYYINILYYKIVNTTLLLMDVTILKLLIVYSVYDKKCTYLHN